MYHNLGTTGVMQYFGPSNSNVVDPRTFCNVLRGNVKLSRMGVFYIGIERTIP